MTAQLSAVITRYN